MSANRAKFTLTGTGILKMVTIAILLLNFGCVPARHPNKGAHNQGSQSGQWDRWNPNWMQRDMWGSDHMGLGMRQRKERHRTFMHQGVPVVYRAARNPLSPDTTNISKGRSLYQSNCAVCHGATGMGDGEAAKSLNPSPALLAHMIQMPMSVDEYMLWSISDGGSAFGTSMPAFKDVLTKDEIWQVVTYMRAGFPSEQTQ
jgi:mono/diheme cytochrome c family protein